MVIHSVLGIVPTPTPFLPPPPPPPPLQLLVSISVYCLPSIVLWSNRMFLRSVVSFSSATDVCRSCHVLLLLRPTKDLDEQRPPLCIPPQPPSSSPERKHSCTSG